MFGVFGFVGDVSGDSLKFFNEAMKFLRAGLTKQDMAKLSEGEDQDILCDQQILQVIQKFTKRP